MTDFCVVIPARYASTRLPGKPLLDIGGKPMLRHVWERAGLSSASRVVIATDDPRIAAQAQAWGAQVCLTRADHPSGTDRLQEVAQQLGLGADDIVVNVQGDEPLIPPQVIDQVANNLADAPDASIATLCERIDDWGTLLDPNAVKVVADAQGFALYFSRAPIAFPRGRSGTAGQPLPEDGSWWRHIGIYAYRAGTLHRFVTWPVAPLEALEQLEQLRALYNGERIHVTQAAAAVPGGVDTAADLEKVRAIVAEAASREP